MQEARHATGRSQQSLASLEIGPAIAPRSADELEMTLYAITVPAFLRGLQNLSCSLERAADSLSAQLANPEQVLSARLAPDMLSLADQVRHAADTAKLSTERLSGKVAPRFSDDEASLADLHGRIARTRSYLTSISPAEFPDEPQLSGVDWAGVEAGISGADYVSKFALPNFYFHLAVAHAILRAAGASIGKLDYLGAFNETTTAR